MPAAHHHDRHRPPEARQAKDVMALGQEIGRVLSDGRIIGRAEPYAKVFASSRAVKREIGLIAWGILEDVALDARIDAAGRLVAETNVRRIAANLALSKNTVQKHLARLRDYGLVWHEELRESDSGRYETARYVIDPSACIERFTTTPGDRSAQEKPEEPDRARVPESGTRSMSQSTGHREVGQTYRKQDAVVEQQHAGASARDGDDRGQPTTTLLEVGVASSVVSRLVDEHPAERIRDAVTAVQAKTLQNPAGWVVRAISEGWDVSAELAEVRRARARRQTRETDAARLERARVERQRHEELTARWSQALSAALDDDQLREAIEQLTEPLPGLGRRSTPAVEAARGWLARTRRLLEGLEPGAEHGWLDVHEADKLLHEHDTATARRLAGRAAELGRVWWMAGEVA